MDESKNDEVQSASALRQHLINSLKFHHQETLQRIPQELAIRAMTEAWSSCHLQDDPNYCSGASTALIPQEQAAKAIRESKYFAG